jgi:hypothetical protein
MADKCGEIGRRLVSGMSRADLISRQNDVTWGDNTLHLGIGLCCEVAD